MPPAAAAAARRLGTAPAGRAALWTAACRDGRCRQRKRAGHGTAPAGGVAGAVARSDSGGDEPDPIRDASEMLAG